MNNISSSDKFCMSRFILLAKREIISNKRLFLLELLVVIGVILLGELFISYAAYPSPNDLKDAFNHFYYLHDRAVYPILIVGNFGLSIFSTIAASLICSGLSNKKGRINNFMAVGTPFEKYLLNFLIYIVFFVLFYIVVWLVIDTIRVFIVDMIYPFQGTSIITCMIKETRLDVVIIMIASFLFNQAYYALVSAFSPRLAFLKAFGLSYAIGFLAIPYSILFAFMYRDLNTSIPWAVGTASVLLVCFAVAMHWLAYFRYTETDII